MNLNFIFQSIEQEASAKVTSMISPSDDCQKTFLKVCEEKFVQSELDEIQAAFSFAKNMESKDGNHPSMVEYFNHPIRVATMTAMMLSPPQLNSVLLSLVHNVYEVGYLQESDLIQAGFSEKIARSILLLTIDRDQQTNPVYLKKYYADIVQHSNELTLIRCLDKLDNVFAFELIEDGEHRSSYLRLTQQFVVPMAKRLSIQFGNYMQDSIKYMLENGCNEALRDKFRSGQEV